MERPNNVALSLRAFVSQDHNWNEFIQLSAQALGRRNYIFFNKKAPSFVISASCLPSMKDVTHLFCDPNLGANGPEDSRQNWTAQLLQVFHILLDTGPQSFALAPFFPWFPPLLSLSCDSATAKPRMRNLQVRQEWWKTPRQHRDPSDTCTPDPRAQTELIWLWKTTKSHLGATLGYFLDHPTPPVTC